MISFVVPAHNEEAWVGRCVAAIHAAMKSVGESFEVIVVDDSSADATAAVARREGARVIQVRHRQISATRNAGARQARGEILFFVDADTLVSAGVIRSAVGSIRAGAVGGGCVPQFEGRLPLWWRVTSPFALGLVRLLKLPGGACQFCTRAAFEATGGFSERHFAAEDAVFVAALKRQGRFVLPREPVVTSGRNLRAHSLATIVKVLVRLAIRGPNGFRDRRDLHIWYDPKRETTRSGNEMR